MEKQPDYLAEIAAWKKARNAILLAHYYQPAALQAAADYVGDSLELARQAAASTAAVIVVCGVRFMAETAALLCPDKTVLLPQPGGCGMADSITVEGLRTLKKQQPDAIVVGYVNTSAAVKAECDICCTSANAAAVVAAQPPERPILFVPDRNLAAYVQQCTGREITAWEGCCPIHEQITPETVRQAKAAHPAAVVLAHPECRPDVLALADYVVSTAGMLRLAADSDAREFIIVTEAGLQEPLQAACPDKRFYWADPQAICADMRRIEPADVIAALTTLAPVVTVDGRVAANARQALAGMLAIGRQEAGVCRK